IHDLHNLMPWTPFYTDDVIIASESRADFQCQAQVWSDHLAMFGLCLNVRKMEYLTISPNVQIPQFYNCSQQESEL
ncbi:hypothetical protein JRQ81_012672, partial [Phrynocephalus forsythii]